MKGLIPAKRAQEPQEVGGKAAALSRLMAAGFDVPAFLVLTDDAFADHGTNLLDPVTGALPDALAALGPGLEPRPAMRVSSTPS